MSAPDDQPMSYTVWCPEQGHGGPQDGRQFSETDPNDAAIDWAEWEDRASADYWIVGGQTPIVFVRAPCGETFRVQVSGKPCPTYSATALGRF